MMPRTLPLAMLACAALLSACAAVPGPMLANAGVNMATNSGGSFISGSMENTFVLPLDPVQAAVRETAEDLRYQFIVHSTSRTSRTFYLRPERGESFRVRIIQHTPTVTTISVRVGLLGDQNLSRFLMAEIERRLPERPVETRPPAAPAPPPAVPPETTTQPQGAAQDPG